MPIKYPSGEEARALLVEIGKRMYQQGYVVTNDGNMSLKLSANEIMLTPTGVSKGFMTPESMVRMSLNEEILEAGGKPSSEAKMHLRVYRENPEVNAVVHAHPVSATTFAVAGIPLDLPIMLEASVQLGVIPVARYAATGTEAVADSIAPFCKDYAGVLLSNHGALTWGPDLLTAYHRLEILENYARVTLNLLSLGKMRLLSREQMVELGEVKKKLGIRDGVLQKGAEEPQNMTDILP